MSGHHNMKIYTEDDNPWCKTCLNGERIVGEKIFKGGAYVCYCGGIPVAAKCDNYQAAEVWIVAYQEPRDRIVAIRRRQRDAEEKAATIPPDRAVLVYPCPGDAVFTQSGYDPRLVIR